MAELSSLASLLGCGCCCILFFVILLVVLSFVFRPKKPRAEEIEGLAPAPERGVSTSASLTRMGDESEARTMMLKRGAPSPTIAPPDDFKKD